jgi:sialidase-1
MVQVRDLTHIPMYSDPANFCAEVSVANLGGGEIVAIFAQQRGLAHTDTGTILLIRSLDHGRSWDEVSKVVVFPQEEDLGWNIAAITKLADGRLVACANCWRYLDNGRIDWAKGNSELGGVFLAWSTDKGQSWSAPQRVNNAPMLTAWVRDSILELPDGKLLLPLEGHMHRRAIPYDTITERSRSYVLCSEDGGRHWIYWGTIAYDAADITNFSEPGLTRLADGRLLALLRTERFPRQAEPGEQYAPPAGYLFAVTSHDDGISWSWPVNTGIWGYPADLITLPNGTVLCAYSYRTKPMGVRVAVSADGMTWRREEIFTIADYDMYQVTPTFTPRRGETASAIATAGNFMHIGYPSSVQLDDGRILTAYHLFSPDGRQVIECAMYRVI